MSFHHNFNYGIFAADNESFKSRFEMTQHLVLNGRNFSGCKTMQNGLENGFALKFYCDMRKPTPSQKQLEKAPKIYSNKRLTMAQNVRFYVT